VGTFLGETVLTGWPACPCWEGEGERQYVLFLLGLQESSDADTSDDWICDSRRSYVWGNDYEQGDQQSYVPVSYVAFCAHKAQNIFSSCDISVKIFFFFNQQVPLWKPKSSTCLLQVETVLTVARRPSVTLAHSGVSYVQRYRTEVGGSLPYLQHVWQQPAGTLVARHITDWMWNIALSIKLTLLWLFYLKMMSH